jgi:hypothetical protein
MIIAVMITAYSRSYGLLGGKDNPRYAGDIAVTAGDNTVTYAPSLSPGTNRHINIIHCRNADNEDIGYTIVGDTVYGFVINVTETATVKYEVNVY